MFFFIFPIGNESLIRRLPYVTIGLIALNTLLWLVTNGALVRQERRLEQLDKEMQEIETPFLHQLVSQQPEILRMEPEEYRRLLAESQAIPHDSYDYRQWFDCYQRFQDIRNHSVFHSWGFMPGRFSLWKIITSMFIHGNFWHLFFNLLFLWMVGCNIEDDWTWKIFLGGYALSGIAAALLHAAVFPHSLEPLIGASGAIAGIMGAFMVRHFKTKIRFAYFALVWFRPVLGRFGVWAGVALPFWFLEQIVGAKWSGGDAVAYYAHIGGFVFGALVGLSLKFLGLEKKYIEPMVEKSFEKLKLSPKLKQAHQKLEEGQRDAAQALLVQVMAEEPRNVDAPLTLARLASEAGKTENAAAMYNRALEVTLSGADKETSELLFQEIKEKAMAAHLSEKNLFGLASLFDRNGKAVEASELYEQYISAYPQGKVKAKVLGKICALYRDKLHDEARAQAIREQLAREFPDFVS
ncbi:MAG: rhomboid family intramembrane serine protease [Candidatus Edwardsbacteria bacterium]|nr:rhomboid family intramembrane serine protease [Candidatus Edwardsbacteria bacterium]